MTEVEGSPRSTSTKVWYSASYLPFIFLKGFYATLIKQRKGNIDYKHFWMTEKNQFQQNFFFLMTYIDSHSIMVWMHFFSVILKGLLHSSFNKDKPSAFKRFYKFLKFARLCSKPNGFSWSFLFYQQQNRDHDSRFLVSCLHFAIPSLTSYIWHLCASACLVHKWAQQHLSHGVKRLS